MGKFSDSKAAQANFTDSTWVNFKELVGVKFQIDRITKGKSNSDFNKGGTKFVLSISFPGQPEDCHFATSTEYAATMNACDDMIAEGDFPYTDVTVETYDTKQNQTGYRLGDGTNVNGALPHVVTAAWEEAEAFAF